MTVTPAQRITVIGAALLALFLGALDALIISTAMPTIVADLGGMHLFSWVYSAYFLARAVSLPIFGKLADLYPTRRLLVAAIIIFLFSSAAAGCAGGMTMLIAARAVQGVGAGAIFALVYIVLADVSPPDRRGRTLSLASSVWGIASVLGPTLGGVIVTWFSWRWIFFVNLPLGAASLCGIGVYFKETREKQPGVTLDLLGVAALTTAILAFLFAFLTAGRRFAWASPAIVGLLALAVAGLIAFVRIEQKAADPILSIGFFRNRGFSAGNGAVFLSSAAIFSLFAFAPLFIQGAQGRSPLQVGTAMVSLSLGWSIGSIALGRVIDRLGRRPTAVAGALCLIAGCALPVFFTPRTGMGTVFGAFFVVGVGMGFVALSTLVMVQACLDVRDLGVATASNQFARTLGGTVGVGIGGALMAPGFSRLSDTLAHSGLLQHLPGHAAGAGAGRIEHWLRPEIQAMMPDAFRHLVQQAVFEGVQRVFVMVLIIAVICLAACCLMPKDGPSAADRRSGPDLPPDSL